MTDVEIRAKFEVFEARIAELEKLVESMQRALVASEPFAHGRWAH